MHDLRRDYNRRYYRNVARIWIVAHWKLLRLWIAWRIMQVAFAISPDSKKAIESKLLPKELW